MSKFNKKDMELLSEAYSITLLREQAPQMTISQLEESMYHMTQGEVEYITEAIEGINEVFGGLFGGLKNVGKGVGGSVQRAGQAVGQAVGSAAQKAGNVAKGAGSALKAGVGQAAGNVRDMYNTGKQSQQSQQALQKGIEAIEQLKGYVQQAIDSGFAKEFGRWETLNINQILKRLNDAQSGSAGAAQGAASRGVGGGVGGAMRSAYQSAQQAPPAP